MLAFKGQTVEMSREERDGCDSGVLQVLTL